MLGIAVAASACFDRTMGEVSTFDAGLPARLDLAFGGPDATDEDGTFAEVLDLLVARDGNVWVVDASRPAGALRRPEVRVFDSAGRFLRTVGAAGDGPGEYRAPFGLAQLHDGRIAIRDNHAGTRVLLFNEQGSLDTVWTLPTVQGRIGAPNAIRVADDSSVWMLRSMRPTRASQGTGFVRLDARGQPAGEVTLPPLPDLGPGSIRVTRTRPDGAITTQAIALRYQPSSRWAWSPRGYFLTGRSDVYRLEPVPWRPVADWVAPLVHSRPAIRISADERSALRAEVRTQLTALDARGTAVPEPARSKPTIVNIMVADDGRILVRVAAPSIRVGDRWSEAPVYDVFDPEHRFLGTFHLPAGVRVLRVVRNRVWGVLRDEAGAETVVRYDIGPSAGTGDEAPTR
jgi:hypothetical protein